MTLYHIPHQFLNDYKKFTDTVFKMKHCVTKYLLSMAYKNAVPNCLIYPTILSDNKLYQYKEEIAKMCVLKNILYLSIGSVSHYRRSTID